MSSSPPTTSSTFIPRSAFVLAEFLQVLKPNDFAVITCPDLQAVCAVVAEDKLTELACTSPAGSKDPVDTLYGHRTPMARANLYLAHRCGFTQRVLAGESYRRRALLLWARRGHTYYTLYAVATKAAMSEEELRALAATYFPSLVGMTLHTQICHYGVFPQLVKRSAYLFETI